VNDKLTEIFAEVLGVDARKVNDQTSPENTQAWDSLANMTLLAAIEETFKVELNSDEIEDMQSLGSVRKILLDRGVALN
jgi:acyl carrier protein